MEKYVVRSVSNKSNDTKDDFHGRHSSTPLHLNTIEEPPISLERSKPSEDLKRPPQDQKQSFRKSSVRSGTILIVQGSDEDDSYTVRLAGPKRVIAYNVGSKASGRFSTLTMDIASQKNSKKRSFESSIRNSGAKTSVASRDAETNTPQCYDFYEAQQSTMSHNAQAMPHETLAYNAQMMPYWGQPNYVHNNTWHQ